ncbi:MAG: hypothetical protein M3O70_02240 [Actinomycetota bacterium]|nr:hypothetical protein [Actinomycetota bacterium]
MNDASRAIYWVFTLVLIGFGAITGLSIGMPFFVLGITLLVLAPFRERPTVFWPTLSAVISFFIGYVLVAPLRCTSRVRLSEGEAVSGQAGTVECTNLLGLDYSGTGTYNPPLWPAVLTGTLIAAAVWILLRRTLRRRLNEDYSHDPTGGRLTGP